MCLPKQTLLNKTFSWCLMLLWLEPTAGTRSFSVSRGYKVSDDFQFVLFMKQCRTFMCDIHLVRMFYSTQNYGSDTFCLMRCLLNQFSYLSKFPTRKDFFETQQEKKEKKKKGKKALVSVLHTISTWWNDWHSRPQYHPYWGFTWILLQGRCMYN